MRLTISLDGQLANRVRRAAAARDLGVSEFISRTLDDALKRQEPTRQPTFRLITVSGVHPLPGVDLDRPRALEVEDDETRPLSGRR